jgi:Cof subfamily protein (haloacid dehalogenase superfamily)
MTKLIAIDLDGTLLNSRHTLTETSRQAVREAILRGYHVTVVTGRMSTSAILYARFLGIRMPIVCLNGANIVEPANGRLLHAFAVPKGTVVQLLRIAKEMQIPYFLYGERYLMTAERTRESDTWQLRSMVRAEGASEIAFGQAQYFPVMIQDTEEVFEPIYKVSLECDSAAMQRKVLEQVGQLTGLCIKEADPWRVHVTKEGVHKKNALDILAEQLQISLEDVVAFGNADNDLEMITGVGTGIAVANATASIRRNAQFITASNDDSGVAKEIMRIIERENGTYVTSTA